MLTDTTEDSCSTIQKAKVECKQWLGFQQRRSFEMTHSVGWDLFQAAAGLHVAGFLGHYWEAQPPNPQNNWGLCCFCSTAWNFLMSVTSQVWSQHMNLDLNGEMPLVLQSTGARTLPAGEWCRDYEVWMGRGSLCLEHSQKGRKQFRAESGWEISQLMMLKDWEIISLFFFFFFDNQSLCSLNLNYIYKDCELLYIYKDRGFLYIDHWEIYLSRKRNCLVFCSWWTLGKVLKKQGMLCIRSQSTTVASDDSFQMDTALKSFFPSVSCAPLVSLLRRLPK